MVRPGHVMENPVSGEDRIVFTKTAQQTGGEVFELEVFIRAGAPGTPEMVHSLQDESFKILSGSLDFRIGGQERRLKAGESLLIPKGTPHNWWNERDEEAHALVEIRPALRSEEFFANLYGLCSEKGALPNLLQLGVLIDEHKDEGSYLTKPPLLVQKVMFGVLAPVGRLLGYKAHYPKYSGLEEPSSDEGASPPSTTKVVARALAMAAPLLLSCFFLYRSRLLMSQCIDGLHPPGETSELS
jgi:mannose-6-phosphate isomerase-like protein (cupin superfamily)